MTQPHDITALLSELPGGVLRCYNDSALTIETVNTEFLVIFGYTRQELQTLMGNQYINLVCPEDRPHLLATLAAPPADGIVDLDYRAHRKDGTVLRILDRMRVTSPPTREACYCHLLLDITLRKQEQEALRLSLERLQLIMAQTNDIIFEWDLVTDTLYFSTNWEARLGYPPITSNATTHLADSHNIHPDERAVYLGVIANVSRGVPYSEGEFRLRSQGDAYRWYRIRNSIQFGDDGTPVRAVGVLIDIDAEKSHEQKLLEQAQRDALTGLYHKSFACTQSEALIARRQPGMLQALIILDLDDFKLINDRYGHLCGDAVLSDLAALLKGQFCAPAVVGRIGGDEFLVFLPDLLSREAAVHAVEATLTALRALPLRGVSECGLPCSIGVAIGPDDGESYQQLYGCADLALYQAKSRGKCGYVLYDPSTCAHAMLSGIARSAISDTIDSDELSGVDQKLAQYAFQLLYNAMSPETAVQQILEIIGRAYDVSRVYIFESTPDGLYCNNTFEWCSEGVAPEIEHLQRLSYVADLGDYLTNFNENGVFYCRDIKALHPSLYHVLAPQGIVSLLQCAILDDTQFRGYVGFDECRVNRYWTQEQIRSLSLVANVLSTFLIKLRLKERVATLERAASTQPTA